ncbi:hypothetical protein B566_EDAN002059 [Ephemera danica]|nr:hypothetical protein B566_EDAN002059 [Ephemera danica]
MRNHSPRLVSTEEAAHVVLLSELRNKHKVCFLQSAYERLFVIEVYFRGQVIHAACQWIPEPNSQTDEEAPLGTLEVVSVVDTQCHTWKGYLPIYPTNFQVPHGMLTNSIYPCLSLPLPWAYHTHVSHIVIHVGLHMMPKHPTSIMPLAAAAPSSPVRYHHTPSPQQPQDESQQQEERSEEEEEGEEEEEHTEEEGENLVILEDGSQSKET